MDRSKRSHEQSTIAIEDSRDVECIALLIAVLNDLEVKSADILNVYVRHLSWKRCGAFWILSLEMMLVE